MNIKKLHQAEAQFLNKYPGGFAHIEMQELGKKHKMDQMIELTQQSFANKKLNNHREISDNIVKITSRSSMISMFEKLKLKQLINALNNEDIKPQSNAQKNRLHGNQQKGFETMVDILKAAKLAQWSLVTILPNYYYPDDEVFVKPTTTKSAITYFELENLEYKPAPTWEFYLQYKAAFMKMKKSVDDSLAPHNAAFGGFLMMYIKN